MADKKEEEQAVIRYQSRDGQEIDLSFELVRHFLISGKKELVTKQELFYFMGICKSRGLNPFKKDAYLIKYDESPAAVVTSIDFYRSRARSQPDCVGWKSGVIIQHKEPKSGLTTLEYREGNLVLEGEVLVGGWFEAKPTGWVEPFKHTVNLKPYIKVKKTGEITQFWREENQPMMIQKVAEAQGLRKLWPDQFQQLYLEGEILEAERTIDETLSDLAKKEIQMPKEKQPESETKEVPKEPEAIVIGLVTNVETKLGPTDGKTKKPSWTLYNIYIKSGDAEAEKYGTFDPKIMDVAKRFWQSKTTVEVTWKQAKQHKQITEIKEYVEREPGDEEGDS
jgi:phage recombination protein Bet